MLDVKPLVRAVGGDEIDAMLSNIAHATRTDFPFPYLIACRVTRRGNRRDGTKINSPRSKPLFLHLLLVASYDPHFRPGRAWLGDVELRLDDGWATNPEWCDNGVSLVYCKPFSGFVTHDIMARVCDLRGRPLIFRSGPHSYIYLQLEWRRWVFPSGIPELRIE